LSALTVHFRDIRDLLTNILLLWFFSTPIIYYCRQENVQRFKVLFDLTPLRAWTFPIKRSCSSMDPSATGNGCWPLVLPPSRSSWRATGFSIGCGTHSLRPYDPGHRACQRIEDLLP